MKKILPVAKLTFFTPFQRGGGWMLYLLIGGVAAFMFTVSRSDGVLIHELQLRLRFALSFSISLLSLSLLWYACVSLRGDIDAKRLHVLTSYPIPRRDIYLGKWLGMTAFGALGVLWIGVIVLGCSLFLIRDCKDPEQLAQFHDDFVRVTQEVSPIIPNARALAEETVSRQVKDGIAIENRSEAIIAMAQEISRRQQQVVKNGERRWRFELSRMPDAEWVELEYRFYCRNRDAVEGLWVVFGNDGIVRHGERRQDKPYQTHRIRIPVKAIPEDLQVFVKFTGVQNPNMIFYNRSGMLMRIQGGHWIGNVPKLFAVTVAHLALVVAVGLTAAAMFHLSTASFVAMVLYVVAMAGDFFQRAIQAYEVEQASSFLMQLGFVVTRLGLFLVTGMQAPSSIIPFSEGTMIGLDNIGMAVTREVGGLILKPLSVLSDGVGARAGLMGVDLALGYLVYFAIVMGLGIWLITRKELDRVH